MRVFFDVDTQNDFMNKDGALYVPNAELIKPNLKKLTDYVLKNKLLVLGSTDVHHGTKKYREREGELQRWGGPFPDHCMVCTEGEKKIPETIIKRDYSDTRIKEFYSTNFYIPPETFFEGNEEVIKRTKKLLSNGIGPFGIYFEKQCYDVFTNTWIELYLKKFNVKESVVYGVATDYCVKAAVLGMQKRGIQCYVVEDAMKGVAPDKTKAALEEMLEAGAEFVKTKDVLEGRI
jgi:nicotinamidase/pyrazinamidase